MERKVKLIIAYDGTDFHGWQSQPGVRTVQEELEKVIGHVVRHPLQLVGASRTDAGVHARGQVAHLCTTSSMPVENLRRAIAGRLPSDLAVVHVAEIDSAFHATRDAQSKLYRYKIYHTPHRPAEKPAARYCWHVWHRLDVDNMRAAAMALIGRHDFVAYANRGSKRETTVRNLIRIGIWPRYDNILVDVEGAGFLYNQIRIVVGTLVEVGRGHWPPRRVAEILHSQDRGQAGPTAPPQGLCLRWVRYGPDRSAVDGA